MEKNSERENSEQLDQMIKVVSHQLKSPINSIESLLNVIANGFTGDADSKTLFFIEKAIKKTREARELITDIIKYETYMTDQSTEKTRVDIVNLLGNVGKNYLLPASEKNILLSLNLPEQKKILVHGNTTGLELVFKNLIENAIKYTEANGNVIVSLVEQVETQTCLITIRDTGLGIDNNEINEIFEPFFRTKRNRLKITGTGLGLAIVKRVVENHNGKIFVSSEVNHGTTFTLALPYLEIRAHTEKNSFQKRVVIIGGVTAGPKAAARLRRLDENLDITIIEKSEFLSYSGCGLPAYISGKVSSPRSLMTTADNTLRDVHFFESIKNINILHKTEAVKIDRKQKGVIVKDSTLGKMQAIPYDILILATGAQAIVPNIPGIRQEGIYSLYSIEDAEAIKKELSRNPARDIYIIGGGLIGVETSESIMSLGARVTILEKTSYILNFFDPEISVKIQNELSKKGIKIITEVNTREIRKTDNKLVINTDQGYFYADLIILSTGVKPNTALGKAAGLSIGKAGGIKVNSYLQTSDKNIYAIGDCAESKNLICKKQSYLPLGSISTKMGRMAADNICGNIVKYPGNTGTVMFSSFDINVARTGIGIKDCEHNGFDAETIIVSGLDRSHYYGNARNIFLKIIADKKTMKILGAQGYGGGDVVKRIAVVASAIAGAMTLDDLFHIDLGYYPAYNNPIDIVQYACLLLKGKITGFYTTLTSDEFKNAKALYHTVDVSPAYEYSFDNIPESINIPLENMRTEDFPFTKESRIVLYSKTSSRAYEAYRYLLSKGFKSIFILEGGFLFWKY